MDISRRTAQRAVTEHEMLNAARDLLDAGGPDAASIRRIAAAVGVPANTVYTYFPNRAAIENALVERLLGELNRAVRGRLRAGPAGARSGGVPETEQLAPHEGEWRRRLEGFALDLRTRLVAHPGLVPLLLARPAEGPNALQLTERLLTLLAAAGLAAAPAARGAYLIMVYLLGAISLETVAGPRPGRLAPEPERIEARRTRLAEVPAERYPRTAAVAELIAAGIGADQFLWGLRRLLDGLAAAAA